MQSETWVCWFPARNKQTNKQKRAILNRTQGEQLSENKDWIGFDLITMDMDFRYGPRFALTPSVPCSSLAE
jgi:hypothetical protein